MQSEPRLIEQTSAEKSNPTTLERFLERNREIILSLVGLDLQREESLKSKESRTKIAVWEKYIWLFQNYTPAIMEIKQVVESSPKTIELRNTNYENKGQSLVSDIKTKNELNQFISQIPPQNQILQAFLNELRETEFVKDGENMIIQLKEGAVGLTPTDYLTKNIEKFPEGHEFRNLEIIFREFLKGVEDFRKENEAEKKENIAQGYRAFYQSQIGNSKN